MKSLIVDCLAAGKGKRKATIDVIGAGPRTVAGVLEDRDISVELIPAKIILNGDYALDDYDLLLLSGMTTDSHTVRKVSMEWRKTCDGPILLGGPIAADPIRMLRKTKTDVAVVGEGEETLKEILDIGVGSGQLPSGDKLGEIKGIAYMKNGRGVLNPLRPVMSRKGFDLYQPSTNVISEYPLYQAARVYVEILRGCSNYYRAKIGSVGELCDHCSQCSEGKLSKRYYCPHSIPPGCGYCSVPSLYGPPKSRSVKKIRKEIEELLKEGVRRVVFSAPCFLDYGRDLLVEPKPLTDPRKPEPHYEKIEELLDSITSLNRFQEGEASLLIENVKASLVTESVAELIGKYLSDSPVSIGFETGSLEHSINLGRPSTPEETLKAIKRLSQVGLRPYVYFIHGLPGQNKNTVRHTVDAIKRSVECGARRIILYRFSSLPMSAFANEPSGPPSVTDPLSYHIYEAAMKANLEAKEDLLGQKVKVVIAEPYDRDSSLFIAYPMNHGPVVLVENAEGRIGNVVDVKITGIQSKRIVKGRI